MYRELFDEEHRKAFVILNSLQVGKNSGALIGQLIDHVSLHFISEDRFMRLIRYPKELQERHIEEHGHVQNLILGILPKLISGNIIEEDLELLREQLTLHIKTIDQGMINYAQKFYPEILNGTEPLT
jgi:hemerythrin